MSYEENDLTFSSKVDERKTNKEVKSPTRCKNRWPKPGSFVKIEVSSLSLNDDFLKYIPKNEEEELTKEKIIKIIKSKNIRDFERPNCDPTVIATGEGQSMKVEKITYEKGKTPYIYENYAWWRKYAEEINLRVGNDMEYTAFLAVLMKTLVKNRGWTIKHAWEAVCVDSSTIAKVRDRQKMISIHGSLKDLDPTGSKCVCGFYDLGNTMKLLADSRNDKAFWIAGTCAWDYPAPISSTEAFAKKFSKDWIPGTVGWLVRDIK